VLQTERAARLKPLRRRLAELELDAVFISGPANIRYLSGFTGSLAYLIVGQERAEILGDSRYWIQMEQEAPGFELVRSAASVDLFSLVPERLASIGARRVGFEAQHLTVSAFENLRGRIPQTSTLRPTQGLVEELRLRKTEDEVARLKAAASISSRAFDRIRRTVRPGLRERDLAFLLDQTFRELGADSPAFETIVASGENGALPHAHPTDREVQSGDMIVFDFGARVAGYCSDISRTVVAGEPDREQRRVIDAVRQAQSAALEVMRPGITADAVERVARQALAGSIDTEHAFGHPLGHGVGLEIHERPILAQRDRTELAPGMVITCEPGVYVPGWGGVRIEDMVLITAAGHEVLTTASYEVAVGP
jgi:Xaa-Pro aminopeptidase